MLIRDLKTNNYISPLGLDTTQPSFSWLLYSKERSQFQKAYQIHVASDLEDLLLERSLLWDSGKVETDQSIHIKYEGPPLKSNSTYYWRVKVWDKHNQASPWSESAYWSMGLLNKNEWQAKWIGAQESTLKKVELEQLDLLPSSYLRKDFSAAKVVQAATLHVSALGLYEIYINESRVGEDFFTPGFTDYHTRVQYQTYDVTKLIGEENAIGAVLGTGWYSGYLGMMGKSIYDNQPYLLLQLTIEYKDGSVETVETNETWKVTTGPIVYSDLIKGEYYDARLELNGWSAPNYDASTWDAPKMKQYDGEVVSQVDPPIKITERITPIKVSKSPSGTIIYDMGQNMVGWTKLLVSGKRGAKVVVKHAEMLKEDGSLYIENLRTATPYDNYILKGEGIEQYRPRFTFHGFRFVEVIAEPSEITSISVEGEVVHSDTPPTGGFETSNKQVNQLFSNIIWGQRGNFLSIPTDCPQRNERMGWTGDAQIFIRTATYNMDVLQFFRKYSQDMVDAQLPSGAYTDIVPDAGWIEMKKGRYEAGATIISSVIHPPEHWLTEGNPGWGDAGVIIPWTLYLVYGDREILEKHYQSMTKWIDYLVENSTDYLRPDDTIYGDWLSIDADTPKEVLSTAYFAYSVQLMQQVAGVLDKKEDQKHFQHIFENIKRAFNEAFVDAQGYITGNTQTSYVLPLHMGLIPEAKKKLVSQRLVENIHKKGGHLSTGFLGVGYLLPVLTENGYIDEAYKLLNKDTFPSWMYSVKHGATTIWERWDGWTAHNGFQNPEMNSFNHYSLGSVGEWMYRYVAGINVNPEGPGFKKIMIQPRPGGGLSYVKGQFKSVYGEIKSEWKLLGDDQFFLRVTIPVNTTATVVIPGKVKGQQDLEDVIYLGENDGNSIYKIGSGDYEFQAVLLSKVQKVDTGRK